MSDEVEDTQPSLVRLVAQILDQLRGTAVTECEFRTGDYRVLVRRLLTAVAPLPSAPGTPQEEIPSAWRAIHSPLTGIFYLTEAPQSPPFVSMDAHVSEQQIVGLIESMKMYNPVESDVAGIVRAILVQSGSVVEKGQVLMYLEPAGDQG